MPDSKELVVPEAAVEAAIALAEERTGRVANRELFAEILTAAYPEIHRAVVAEERERMERFLNTRESNALAWSETAHKRGTLRHVCAGRAEAYRDVLDHLTALTEQADNPGGED